MPWPTPPHYHPCPESQGPIPVTTTRCNIPFPLQPCSSPHTLDHRPLCQHHPQYKATRKRRLWWSLWPKVQAPPSTQPNVKLRSHTMTSLQQLFQRNLFQFMVVFLIFVLSQFFPALIVMKPKVQLEVTKQTHFLVTPKEDLSPFWASAVAWKSTHPTPYPGPGTCWPELFFTMSNFWSRHEPNFLFMMTSHRCGFFSWRVKTWGCIYSFHETQWFLHPSKPFVRFPPVLSQSTGSSYTEELRKKC